jgi:small subunit ribosomal protein S3
LRSKRPELEAHLLLRASPRQIESRISYRRAIKMAIAASMRMNAEGIKVPDFWTFKWSGNGSI